MRPATTLATKFSVPHIIAATLLHGEAGVAEFTHEAMNDPEIKARINEAGFNTLGNSPEEFTALIRSQIDLVGRIVKSAGIQATE